VVRGQLVVGGGRRCCKVKALSEILLQSKPARRSKQATAGQVQGVWKGSCLSVRRPILGVGDSTMGREKAR